LFLKCRELINTTNTALDKEIHYVRR
jgi:hypothetical protein